MKPDDGNKDQNKSDSSRVFICIDLKSFYASVECLEQKLNPLTPKGMNMEENATGIERNDSIGGHHA